MEFSNEETKLKVQHLTELIRKREQLDAEISKLREEINVSIVEQKEDAPNVRTVKTPPPYHNANLKIPASSPAAANGNNDGERNIGIRWMAVAGVSIAVLGLIICIKILVDRGMIGPVGRIVLGYLVSAVVVALGVIKVSEKRGVLKDMLIFGGSFFAYGVTCLAYGYFDLYSSPVTLAILWTIAAVMLVYTFWRDNKLLFNLVLLAFEISPFCAGYTMAGQVDITVFWMVFVLIVNLALFYVYKAKKWSSSLVTSFIISSFVFVVSLIDGADRLSFWKVVSFSLCCAVFYAGSVLLHRLKEKFDGSFVLFNVFNFALYILCVSIVLSSKEPIACTFGAMSSALIVSVFVFNKILSDNKFYFNASLSFAIFFANAALLVIMIPEHAYMLPVMYAVEIIAVMYAYQFTLHDYYKRLLSCMVFFSFLMFLCCVAWMDGWANYGNLVRVVFNSPCVAKILYVAALFFVLYKVHRTHKTSVSIILFFAIFLTVLCEIVLYWMYVDTAHSHDVQSVLGILMVMIWLLVLSFLYSITPERVNFLSSFSKMGHTFVLISIVLYCIVSHFCLVELRSEYTAIPYPVWRYGTLALLVAASIYAIRSRHYPLSGNFCAVSDIVVSIAAIVAVSSEIHHVVTLSSGDKGNYGLWLSAWFGVAALILFVIGFKGDLKYLRTFGFVLSGITVTKIILFDMWNHELWVKAVVFVAVGVCFMLVSYFYTKHLKN